MAGVLLALNRDDVLLTKPWSALIESWMSVVTFQVSSCGSNQESCPTSMAHRSWNTNCLRWIVPL